MDRSCKEDNVKSTGLLMRDLISLSITQMFMNQCIRIS